MNRFQRERNQLVHIQQLPTAQSALQCFAAPNESRRGSHLERAAKRLQLWRPSGSRASVASKQTAAAAEGRWPAQTPKRPVARLRGRPAGPRASSGGANWPDGRRRAKSQKLDGDPECCRRAEDFDRLAHWSGPARGLAAQLHAAQFDQLCDEQRFPWRGQRNSAAAAADHEQQQ